MQLTLPSGDVGGLLHEDINRGLVASFLRKLSIFPDKKLCRSSVHFFWPQFCSTFERHISRLRAFSWNNINIHDWKDIIIHLSITRDFANDLSLYEVAGWYLLDVSPIKLDIRRIKLGPTSGQKRKAGKFSPVLPWSYSNGKAIEHSCHTNLQECEIRHINRHNYAYDLDRYCPETSDMHGETDKDQILQVLTRHRNNDRQC
ncbi:unnamed protein product [Sphagnum jensenii]|uniref:Uncharacterized protein n=1 Tax=Sphagnum jensenii TaxID=128206 RepID=A0ABP1AHC5_9BRYO